MSHLSTNIRTCDIAITNLGLCLYRKTYMADNDKCFDKPTYAIFFRSRGYKDIDGDKDNATYNAMPPMRFCKKNLSKQRKL